MREISVDQITEMVKGLWLEAATNLPCDVEEALRKGLETEESSLDVIV